MDLHLVLAHRLFLAEPKGLGSLRPGGGNVLGLLSLAEDKVTSVGGLDNDWWRLALDGHRSGRKLVAEGGWGGSGGGAGCSLEGAPGGPVGVQLTAQPSGLQPQLLDLGLELPLGLLLLLHLLSQGVGQVHPLLATSGCGFFVLATALQDSLT